MRALCDDYDVVLTTFYFLRSCRAYGDLIDSALGGRPRTRASLSSWARLPGHGQPVLEAIRWRRVVVDEIHQTFESARDTRALQLFDTVRLWGLTGTPALDTEHAQHLYALLARENAHHPNLLAAVIASAVRNHADARVGAGSTHRVQRVQLSAEERLHAGELRRVAPGSSVEDVAAEVRHLTFVDDIGDASLEEAFRARQEQRLRQLQEQHDGYASSAAILHRTCLELEREIDAQSDARSGDARRDVLRGFLAKSSRELETLEQRRDEVAARLESARRAHAHIASLGASPPIGTKPCGRSGARRGARGRARAHVRPVEVDDARHARVPARPSGRARAHARRQLAPARRDAPGAPAARRPPPLPRGVLRGLNLPHARTIVFAHAIVAEASAARRLEEQAIARCVRRGQTDDVQIHSFVVADSAEERVWDDAHS